MSAVSRVVAKAIMKMDGRELRELFAEVAREFEVDVALPPEIPHGFILVPREMTGPMIWAAMDHNWTTQTADANIRRMWRNILEVVG